MRSDSKDSENKRQMSSAVEIKEAFKWIDSLSEKEIAKLNLLVKVEVAQKLLTAYLKQTVKQSKKKTRGGDK